MKRKNNENYLTERVALKIMLCISLFGMLLEMILMASETIFYRCLIGDLCSDIFGLPPSEYAFLGFLTIFTTAILALHWGKVQREYRRSNNYTFNGNGK